MSNNSSSSSSGFGRSSGCSSWYQTAGEAVEIPVYYVILPVCISLGLIGRCLCFLAFYRQSKKEPAYYYQIAITVSETSDLIATSGYCVVMIFYWNPSGSSAWYRSSYVMMWYTAHLAVPLMQMAGTVSRLLAVTMAVDRVLAVWKSAVYRNLNHRLVRAVSTGTAVALGVSASIFDCFRYTDPTMRQGSQSYSSGLNTAFMNTMTATVLSQMRDALRCTALLTLIFLNVALIRTYRVQSMRISQLTGHTAKDKTEKRAANAEKTLILLALFQGLFNSLSISASTGFYVALSIKPSIDYCESKFWGPMLDIAVYGSNAADFYTMVIVSKQFRRMMTENVPCLKKFRGIVASI